MKNNNKFVVTQISTKQFVVRTIGSSIVNYVSTTGHIKKSRGYVTNDCVFRSQSNAINLAKLYNAIGGGVT